MRTASLSGMIRPKLLMNKPLVSVLICARNAENYLSAALKSIFNQTYTQIECIVVDDDSTDRTWSILNSFHDRRLILVKNNSRLGVAGSLNRALKKAKGTYIARMDADDVSHLGRLEAQIDFLETHPNIGVVGTWVRWADKDGHILGNNKFPVKDREIKKLLPYKNPFVHPSVTLRHELFRKYGYYATELEGAEDYELWLRFAPHTQFANLPRPLLDYRLHKENVSFNETSRLNIAYAKVQLKKIFVYGYPKWHLIMVIKSLLASFTPKFISQQIYRRFFRYL